MKVTADMKVKKVLDLGEHLLSAFVWLAPEFERLNYPKLRRAMSGRVTVSQAARIANIPLTEALYVLNLAAGADSEELARELQLCKSEDFEHRETNPPRKPLEILGLKDTDPRVHLVDVIKHAEDVLVVHHPFDPIPLRDMFARRGFSSWAEERRLGHWYIYFYRPNAAVGAAMAHPSIYNRIYAMAARTAN